MKMNVVKTLAAATFMAISVTSGAQAVTVINATSGLAAPDRLVTFDEVPVADNTAVTTQYASEGVTFSAGVRLETAAFGFANMSGRKLANFFPVTNSFSIFFASDVTDATLAFATFPGTSTFTALLDGTVVESFSASTGLFGTQNVFGFTDILFDEIAITSGGFSGVAVFDTVAFNVSQVPVPASLPLMFGGLAVFASIRARRKTA